MVRSGVVTARQSRLPGTVLKAMVGSLLRNRTEKRLIIPLLKPTRFILYFGGDFWRDEFERNQPRDKMWSMPDRLVMRHSDRIHGL